MPENSEKSQKNSKNYIKIPTSSKKCGKCEINSGKFRNIPTGPLNQETTSDDCLR
jgi:hypothetical protein